MKMKPTPGPVTVGTRAGFNANSIYDRSGEDAHRDAVICSVSGVFLNMTVEEARKDPRCAQGMANADLIAEAFNAHHETGLSPRELLEQRDGLLRALELVLPHLDQLAMPDENADEAEKIALAAIAAARETKGEG